MQQHSDPDSPRPVRGWRQAYTGKTLPLASLAPALPPSGRLARLTGAHPTFFRRLNRVARTLCILLVGGAGTLVVGVVLLTVAALLAGVPNGRVHPLIAWALLIAVVVCPLSLRGRPWRALLLFALGQIAVVLGAILLFWLLDTLQH